MSMDSLPAELVEVVAQFLSFEDICACSSVSIGWQNAFNIDRVWKRFSSFHSKYFDRQMNKLSYSIYNESYQKCKVKEKALKEKSVEKNILHGNFYVEEVKFGALYFDSMMDSVDQEGNHWLFMSCMEGMTFVQDHKIQVWNLNNDPVMHTSIETPLSNVNRMLNSRMKLNKENFIFLYKNTVLFYDFSYPLYKLTFLKKIQFDSLIVFPDNAITETMLLFANDMIVGFIYTNYHIIHSAPPIVHVWNEEGSLIFNDYGKLQLTEDNFPTEASYPAMSIESDDSGKILIVCHYYNKELRSRCYKSRVFDMSSFQYTDVFIQNRRNIISSNICGANISLMYTKEDNRTVIVKCYRIDSKKDVFKAEFKNAREHIYHELIPNSTGCILLVVSFHTFWVFDIGSKKEIISFNVLGKLMNITTIKHNLFILETLYKDLFTREIWNFQSGQRIYTLNFLSSFSAEEYGYVFLKKYNSPPKVIAFTNPTFAYPQTLESNSIIIINFW